MKNPLLLLALVVILAGAGVTIFAAQKQPIQKQEPLTETALDTILTQADLDASGEAEIGGDIEEKTEVQTNPIPIPAQYRGSIQKAVTSTIPAKAPTTFKIASPSSASFAIGEELHGKQVTTVGSTSDVAGAIVLDWSNPQKSTVSQITVDARTLKTDDAGRDAMIRGVILKSDFPDSSAIIFTPISIKGLPKAIKEGDTVKVSITGDLTIAGVTRSVTFSGAVTPKGADTLTGRVTATIRRSDFSLEIPMIPFVASVDESLTLSLSLVAKAQ